jgi:hypothetical protein
LETRCCQNCVYAGPLDVPCCGLTALVCANRAQCPGRLKVVDCDGECRNFRAKRRVPARAKPPGTPEATARAKAKAVPRPAEPPEGDICYIPLTKDQFAIIDASDYERVSQYRWYASFNGAKFYACTYGGGKRISMHRLLMNTPKGMVVDHINGNPLNNRRCNMRNCTQAQNGRNRGPNPGSECPGVRFCEATGLWRACVRKDGKEGNAGWFADKDEAIRARDRKAVELFGEFAWLHDPPGRACTAESEMGATRENGANGNRRTGLELHDERCRGLCPFDRGSAQETDIGTTCSRSWRGLSLVTKLGSLVTAVVCAAALARRRMPLRFPFDLAQGLLGAALEMVQERDAALETTTMRLRRASNEHEPRVRILMRRTPSVARGPPCGL